MEAKADASVEAGVLRVFEAALTLPTDQRTQWLAGQGEPPEVLERVQRLLAAEQSLGDFLEATPAVGGEPAFPGVGDRVGNYRIVAEIDSGGMGVVYRARRADDAFEQEVAIKLIRPVHLLAPAEVRAHLVERFENERQLLARLQHPNVARIIDGGSTAAGLPYLVMEYIAGLPLTEHCRLRLPGVRERLVLFAKVCDGVQEAHRHLIVHRDLKPENVLVQADGEPRLLDFGIARLLGHDGLADGTAESALSAMTPAYASPEQVRRQPLTTSSDVYSLGVMLYNLLTDTRPYELAGLSPAMAERVVCEATVEPLATALRRAPLDAGARRRRGGELAIDLQRIVECAMHKDPSRRYASAQALGEDVRRFLDGRPVLAHPDSAWYRASRFFARNRLGSSVAAAALVLVLAAAAIALWQAREARSASADMASVNAFLSDVLALTDPYTQGTELTIGQALDGAVERIDTHFAGRPDLASGVRFSLAYSMLSRFQLEAAEKQLLQARAESLAAFGPGHERSIQILEAIANLRLEQGRPSEAQDAFEQVLAAIETGPLRGGAFHGLVLNNLGNLHMTREQYAEAEPYLVRARALFETDDPSPRQAEDHAITLSNLAQAAHGLDQYERADALYADAQARLQALYPDGHPDLAVLLNNRAMLAEDRARPADALALHLLSLQMRRDAFGGEHAMIVVALTNAARQALELERHAQALELAAEAAAMAARVYPQPGVRQVIAEAMHARALLASGAHAPAWAAWELAHAHSLQVTEAVDSMAAELAAARAALCAASPRPGCRTDGRSADASG